MLIKRFLKEINPCGFKRCLQQIIKSMFSSTSTMSASTLQSKMPYFREMAMKLNITIPTMNEEIDFEAGKRCLVYGVKLVEEKNQDGQEKGESDEKKSVYIDEELSLRYEVDKNSREVIEYSVVKRIAEHLQLDVCLMRQQQQQQQHYSELQLSQSINPNSPQQNSTPTIILTLTRFREHIYRQYYTKQLKNKSKRRYLQNQLHNHVVQKNGEGKLKISSDKNKIKSIRIGEDVHANDMKNKCNQVRNWIEQGERTIKVIAHNDSVKSRKALTKFIAMFDKQVQIVEQQILPNPKKKPITRVYAILQFDDQIQVDFEFVNRRWRRREAEIKLALDVQGKKKKSVFEIDFSKQGAQIQKAYLSAFDEAGIPYPKQFDFLTEMDRRFDKQGLMSLVKDTVLDSQQGRSNGIESEELTQKELRARERENRKIMEMRTVEDIIDEMEEMRGREYEMEQYEASRYKELEKQLTDMLKQAKKYAQ